MFRRILVPLDGSLRAERAILVAARLARAGNGMLILMRAIRTIPEEGTETSSGLSLFRAEIRSELLEARQYLAGVASSSHLAGLPLIITEPQGSVMESILATIRTYQADLLVYCEQLAPQEFYPFCDSLAGQLCQRLSIPLFLLPGRQGDSLATQKQPLTCNVIFKGEQPEPALIQPAASLVVSLAEHEMGHLRFMSQRLVKSRFIEENANQGIVRQAGIYQSSSRGSTALLQKAQTNAKSGACKEHIRHSVIILNMPLQNDNDVLLQEMCSYPRLLVPSPAREP